MTTSHVTEERNHSTVDANVNTNSRSQPNYSDENTKTSDSITPSKCCDKRSTKRTQSQEIKLYNEVLKDYQKGFPTLAVSLKHKLSESYADKLLFRMIKKKELVYESPSFEVVPFASLKKVIPNLSKDFGDYVHVDYGSNEAGIILTPYVLEKASSN